MEVNNNATCGFQIYYLFKGVVVLTWEWYHLVVAVIIIHRDLLSTFCATSGHFIQSKP